MASGKLNKTNPAQKNPVITAIRGQAFTEARERIGLSLKELANHSCFSVRQIEQIENGKSDAFYSLAIKVNAAKKVALLLKIPQSDAFEFKFPTSSASNENEQSLRAAANVVTNAVAHSDSDSQTTNSLDHKILEGDQPALSSSVHNSSAADQAVKVQPTSHIKPSEPPPANSSKRRFVNSPALDDQSTLHSLNANSKSGKRGWLIAGLTLIGLVCISVASSISGLTQSDVLEQFSAWFSPKPVAVATVENTPMTEQTTQSEGVSADSAENGNQHNVASVSASPASVTPTSTAISSPAPLATSALPNALEACPSAGTPSSSYTQTQSNRSPDMVYIVSKSNQTVCVVDASGKVQNRSLEAGASASFYGKPPFKIFTSDLSQVDLFFQGWKVRPVKPNDKSIELLAFIPAAPANSSGEGMPITAPASSPTSKTMGSGSSGTQSNTANPGN